MSDGIKRADLLAEDHDTGRVAYIDDDGRTLYVLDDNGERCDVGEITEVTPDGYVVTLFAPITIIEGTVRLSDGLEG